MTIQQFSTGTTLRKSDGASLLSTLRDEHRRKSDFVATAPKLRAVNGLIEATGSLPQITADGVTNVDGLYRPTQIMLDGIADKLKIPAEYLKKMQSDRTDLFDANVNGWLHGREGHGDPAAGAFMLRTFIAGDDGVGVGRAFLSNQYKRMDNLDVFTAALDGVRQAGVPIKIRDCDLTDARMYVRLQCDEIKAYAPTLLKGYRSPFSGASGDENPVVFAGFVISNSEVGAGAYTITPQLVVQVCSNGLTIKKNMKRRVHIGERVAEGLVQWSDETQRKELELIRSKTRDTVKTFLNVDYVKRIIDELEETAGQKIGPADTVIRSVGQTLAFSKTETDLVLEHFILGGQTTAGGVLQAVTSASQLIENADAAAKLEAHGIRAMELAAAM